MEAMPYHDELRSESPFTSGIGGTVVSSDWRLALPTLACAGATLRQLRPSDAPSLFAMLTAEEVTRFISPPPSTVEGFERFIAWTLREQAAGRYLCFAVVAEGYDEAIGIIQVRALEPSFGIAEWGFAIGSSFWGTGIFQESARAVVDFVLGTVGVRRLEARASVSNGRGNAALQKIGATPEAVLRRSFRRNGEYVDQLLWAIVADEWRAKTVWGSWIH